jgi:nitrite reductase (NO-forming)
MDDQGAPSRSTGADRWTTAVGLGAVLSLVVALTAVTVAFANKAGDGTDVAAGGVREVVVELTEFKVTPAEVSVAPGITLVLVVENRGQMEHDLKLAGTTGTKMLAPGQSETVEVGPVSASTEAWCTVPGHKESGMVMKVNVTGGPMAASSGDAAPANELAPIDMEAALPDGWKPFDPTLEPAPGGTEHEVTLRATEKVIEIAPGVKQEMWTFNDQVPGPVLRGKVGDLFTVTLVNEGEVGHSIDFHASQVAMDAKMATIANGESLVYQFRAERSGMWMYHCGTAPVLHHIGNGMYGAVVIDPPDLAPVDREYAFVQSDMYRSTDGEVAGLDKMLAEQWDMVAFNGFFNQYSLAPITTAEAGERVRIWVLDAGPSENSAFHIVGTQFDTVFKEGAYLLRPGNAEKGGSQTLDLQPSQGGFVELTFPEDGTYAQVTHKFASASKGAVAVWHVGDVPEGTSGH